MPFVTRPPGSLFVRRPTHRQQEAPVQTEQNNHIENTLRFFPLETERPPASLNPNPRHRAVNPLAHHPDGPESWQRQAGQRQQQPQPRPPMVPLPPSQPSPPTTPLPPANAAEQFKRVNKNLPDGVHYEPLDAETLQLLRDNGHLPPLPQASSPQVPPPAQTPPQPAAPPSVPITPPPPAVKTSQPPILPPETLETLKHLTNENQTTHHLYKHLTENAPTDEIKNICNLLTQENQTHQKTYQSLLNQYNQNPTPTDETPTIPPSCKKSLLLVLTAENQSIYTLADLLTTPLDPSTERTLQYLINKKTVVTQQLMMLYHHSPTE